MITLAKHCGAMFIVMVIAGCNIGSSDMGFALRPGLVEAALFREIDSMQPTVLIENPAEEGATWSAYIFCAR